MTQKFLIKGMNEEELKSFCKKLAFPTFHGEQLYRWLYQYKCHDINQMKNIPKQLLSDLKENTNLIRSSQEKNDESW